ncbi:MAG TPA: TadE/TadG family type IV pilus assembly protein [Terriglobales bacterium]|nr:TadE/TadG family type IV pilus assembly protein [Terriglobales bacterium]
MKVSRQHSTTKQVAEAGQAVVEFACVTLIMVTMVFALIDFARAIYDKEVMTNISREGSNLASRGTDLASSAAAVIAGSQDLNLMANGRVIITSITNTGSAFKITGQVSQGGLSASSRVGNGVGNPASLPATPVTIPQKNQTVYVTEVFYSYQPVTPIGRMVRLVLPSQLYDVAYF